MKRGERPVIYGDGNQTRDFIYIDDIADNIIRLADNKTTGIVEIGTGINTSFNEIINLINQILDTDIEPIYITQPSKYVQNTPVAPVPFKTSLEEGIRRCLNLR